MTDSPCVYSFGSQQSPTDLKCPDLVQRSAIVTANWHLSSDSTAHLFGLSTCMSLCEYFYVCVCMCVNDREKNK